MRPTIDMIRDELSKLAKEFRQDSIALTIGETEFVPGAP